MLRRFIVYFLAIGALVSGAASLAATVALVPSSLTVNENGVLSVALVLNAADVDADTASAHPGSYRGSVIIDYDPNLLRYDGFAFAAPASLLEGPEVANNTGSQTVRLAFQNAMDVGVIGTYSFTAVGSAGNTVAIGVADGTKFPPFPSFAAMSPTIHPFVPEFIGTEVAIVPLPAAAWLMLSGLGMLGFASRRS